MATTRIIPMHANKGKSIAQSLSDRLDYGTNSEKTDEGEFVSSYACDPKTADNEFLYSKRQYKLITGRVQESDVIAYQIRQSFKPGEITPEEANRIGYEFAMRFTKGDHAFIVATHTDKAHIHNHIYWNSTSLECDRKFRNFWGSTEAVRRLSDLVCMEHRLSVIENPKPHGQSYNKWLGGQAKPCNRDLLRAAIDAALAKKPQSFDELIELVKRSGYEVRFGKNIVFSRPGQKQNIRLKSLGDDYSEADLRAVIAGSKTHAPHKKRRVKFESKHPRLLEQIESRLGSGKGAAYDRAIKVSALKTRAATLLFLQQHDFEDLASFEQYCSGFSEKMNGLQSRIKADEARMSESAILQKQIINYVKTKDVYTEYRKAGYSKKFYNEHESEIIIHKAAKKAFDDLGLKKLPTVKSLKAEYAELLAEKKALYSDYYKLKNEQRDLLIYKANIERIMQMDVEEKDRSRQHQQEEK